MNELARPVPEERPLTIEERKLVRWVLEHGSPGAAAFLPHLERAQVVSRCPCGCASVDFTVAAAPLADPDGFVLGDFLYGDAADPCGVFVFQREGMLAGVEVYGLAGDAPKTLPTPESLRHYEEG